LFTMLLPATERTRFWACSMWDKSFLGIHSDCI